MARALATSDLAMVEWYSDVPRSIRMHTLLGLFIVVFIIGGFWLWGAFAPLASAVIAPGSFVATGENQIIQHLEGGIIKTLLVKEGDHVQAGQDLIQLDETAAHTISRQLELRRLRLEAILARLKAESEGAAAYVAPPSILSQLREPEVQAINDSQLENFESAHSKLQSEVDVLDENITALTFQRTGIERQMDAVKEQRDLLFEELTVKKGLYEKGIGALPVINALQRQVADAEGDMARLQSEMQVTSAQIARFQKQILQVRAAARQEAMDEMQTSASELDAVQEQIREADSVLSRTSVKTPVAGTIVRLYYHTPGGVIESGKVIAEILPSDVPLLIEARIPRLHIDEVQSGQVATIRLSALNQRTTPMLSGNVIYVSADSISDGTAQPDHEIYIARVSIPTDQLARIQGFRPTPGMPAEILIQTEERTFFEYLGKPIADSMARAFREN